jgi:charged multivesicular body protein 6
LALKKKNYQQALLEQTDQQLLNIEKLCTNIEYALVEKEIMQGLQSGNDALKELQKEMSLEKVEQLMQDTEDAIAYQNEVETLMGQKQSLIDEEEIMKELNELERTEQIHLPDVPKTDFVEETLEKQPEKILIAE